ncbi:MAG TPA: lysylphosphatidylglycerol synthase transmembrane domain-containing protein [Kofleriaceae bacterium]|nr:lysylphosphatidylglycerol synthase transmembrane domain-containing protein [Kofleriaceae bacterium]
MSTLRDSLRLAGRFAFRIAAGPAKGRPLWARLVTRLSFVFAAFALVYTILKFPGGPATLPRYFVRIGWFWFAVLAMEVLGTCLDAIAIRAFASPENQTLRLRDTLLAQLSGRAINVVTPTGNLGEVVKMSVLTEYVSSSRAVSTILLYNVARFIIELGFVALAAPFCALLLPMPNGLRWLILAAGAVCLIISLGCYILVRRGMLASVAGALVKLRIISKARYAKWEGQLRAVDDKLKLTSGARRRDRWIGIAAITLSQITSMTLSLSILVAVGESLTVGFVAAYIVGGFVIYNIAVFVPMGLGISEGGWYSLLQAMGESPARVAAGVTMVLARRVTLVMYAAIGLVLVGASSTVKRARERHAERAAASGSIPVTAPAPRVSSPLLTPPTTPITPISTDTPT